MMAALDVVTPVGIIFGADVSWRWVCSGGNPRSGSPGSDDGDARRRSPCWGHHFWSKPWLEVALRWSGVSLSVSTTLHLGGLVPRSLDGGHGLRCARRVVGLFGAMAASMAGTTEFMQILILKIARRFVGDDGFCSVCMRHSLGVY
jgi:hypothetical protein